MEPATVASARRSSLPAAARGASTMVARASGADPARAVVAALGGRGRGGSCE